LIFFLNQAFALCASSVASEANHIQDKALKVDVVSVSEDFNEKKIDNNYVDNIVVTPELLSFAKDLIWNNIEEHNRKLFIHFAKTNSFRPTDKVIFRHPLVIGLRKIYTVENPLEDNSQV